MRNGFRFDGKLLKIANSIKNDGKRLKFLEAIINFGINEEFPQVQGLGDEISKALIIIGHDIMVSEKRSGAGKKGGAQQGNKNAQRENTEKRTVSQTQDSTQTQTELATTTQPKARTEKQKANDKKKHDENIELIDSIKAKVESLGMVYRSGENERINATNIRTSKSFGATAQRFNMTSEQLAFAVIESSMKDKFRSGKINNCEMVYRHYARIINADMKQASSIGFLPGA